jgi:N-acetylmuramoyl-L-alanine amidase CwlA
MSLSMEQVARLTKLSVERIRAYASRQDLGTKVGSRRVFSQSDVKKLLKASDKNKARARTKVTAQKPKQKRTPLKETRKQAPLGIEKKAQIAIPVSIAKPEKKPFWSFLSPRTKQSKKVSLLEVKSPK